MDIDRYIQRNDPTWRRLEHLARSASKGVRGLSDPELDELVDLYQRVSAHLSHARGQYRDPDLNAPLSRILGEALTNVLRHAPGAASVEVAVRRTPTAVEVEVTDSGGTRPGDGGGTGRGVMGMRERAALLGGHVDAGPRPEGGWRVHAVLPCEDDGDTTTVQGEEDV